MPDIDLIRRMAKDKGYAIAEHGSRQRDCDLIAVPWTDAAASPEELVEYLCQGLVHNDVPARVVGPVENKPLGRLAINIQLNGWFKLIDLSICPRIHSPVV